MTLPQRYGTACCRWVKTGRFLRCNDRSEVPILGRVKTLPYGSKIGTPLGVTRFVTFPDWANVGGGAFDAPAVPGRNRVHLWAKT